VIDADSIPDVLFEQWAHETLEDLQDMQAQRAGWVVAGAELHPEAPGRSGPCLRLELEPAHKAVDLEAVEPLDDLEGSMAHVRAKLRAYRRELEAQGVDPDEIDYIPY